MFAQRADKVRRKFIAFVYISAYLAYITVLFFFYLRLWLRLDVFKVISISYGRLFA